MNCDMSYDREAGTPPKGSSLAAAAASGSETCVLTRWLLLREEAVTEAVTPSARMAPSDMEPLPRRVRRDDQEGRGLGSVFVTAPLARHGRNGEPTTHNARNGSTHS